MSGRSGAVQGRSKALEAAMAEVVEGKGAWGCKGGLAESSETHTIPGSDQEALPL